MTRVAPQRRLRVLLRELAIAPVALVLFLFTGKYLLALLRISESSLSISGGVILFLELAAVLAAWLAAAVVPLLGSAIAQRIGARGLIALERLMGMFLIALAVEMLLSGLAEYFRALPA